MRKKKKQKGFYVTVAESMMEGAPFDVSRNGGGWKKVQELLCLYMLRELSDADRHRIWNEYLARVEGVFWCAIKHINDNIDGKHVHLYKPDGKRNIEFLSIKTGYRKAKERNVDRVMGRAANVTKNAVREIQQTMPEKLELFQGNIISAL
jgi:hypothetical protein